MEMTKQEAAALKSAIAIMDEAPIAGRLVKPVQRALVGMLMKSGHVEQEELGGPSGVVDGDLLGPDGDIAEAP